MPQLRRAGEHRVSSRYHRYAIHDRVIRLGDHISIGIGKNACANENAPVYRRGASCTSALLMIDRRRSIRDRVTSAFDSRMIAGGEEASPNFRRLIDDGRE